MKTITIKPENQKLVYDVFIPTEFEKTVVFLPGFRSDSQGTKAQFTKTVCQQEGFAYFCPDYRGHGQSEGEFLELTLSEWLHDIEAMLDQVTSPIILVGSSMGGWLALRFAEIYPDRVSRLILLAPAPDFTEWIKESLSDSEHLDLEKRGYIERASGYPTPHVFSKKLLEDGQNHLLLKRGCLLSCPLTVIQGKKDQAVPWQVAVQLVEKSQSPKVQLVLDAEADHGLSRPEDLEMLKKYLIE